MQLLVSVRSAGEVEAALAGGADIIDAKEPSRGSLGPVDGATLADILARLPAERPASVALGDPQSPEEVVATIHALDLPIRSVPIFLKLGFAGARLPGLVRSLIEAAVASARSGKTPARIVAVAYADSGPAGALSHETIGMLAHEAGAAGVLLDTHTKDGPGLLGRLSRPDLESWVSATRQMGLITALAGSLGIENIEVVAGMGPDVVGVRGAACEGGRHGSVSAERVSALRRRLDSRGRDCSRLSLATGRESYTSRNAG